MTQAAAVSRIDGAFAGGFAGSDAPGGDRWYVTVSREDGEIRAMGSAGVHAEPGTSERDRVKLTSRDELISTGTLDASLEFGTQGAESGRSVAVGIGGSVEPLAWFAIPGSGLPTVGVPGSVVVLDPDFERVASAAELQHLRLHIEGEWSTLVLGYTRATLAYSFATDRPPESLGGPFWVAIDAGVEAPGPAGPARLTVATDGSFPDRQRLLPLPLSLPEPGWSLIFEGSSQISQDQWVADALGFLTGGYFVEIGGDDGRLNSNSYALEERFGWQGIIVEANPRLAAQIRGNRVCRVIETAVYSIAGKELEFVDAGPLGGLVATLQADVHSTERRRHLEADDVFTVVTSTGDDVLEAAAAPTHIDYLSVDTEGSEVEVLQSIDFTRWQVALVTVEHAGRELKRAEVAGVLEPRGFMRKRVWFEDWYWHPGHVAARLGVGVDEAVRRINAAMSRIPEIRRAVLAERLDAASAEGDAAMVRRLLLDGAKPWYANNARFVVGAARMLRREGRIAEAIEVLEMQPDATVPVLRELVAAYGAAGRPGKLFEVVERLLDVDPDLAADPELRRALHEVIPKRPEVLERLREGDHPSRAWALFLDVLGAESSAESPR